MPGAPLLLVIDKQGIVRQISSGFADFVRLEAELVQLMGEPESIVIEPEEV